MPKVVDDFAFAENGIFAESAVLLLSMNFDSRASYGKVGRISALRILSGTLFVQFEWYHGYYSSHFYEAIFLLLKNGGNYG